MRMSHIYQRSTFNLFRFPTIYFNVFNEEMLKLDLFITSSQFSINNTIPKKINIFTIKCT